MPAAASFSYFEAHLACILLATNMPSCPSWPSTTRSEEHTSELQSRSDLVCRLLLEKKKTARPSGFVLSRLVYMMPGADGKGALPAGKCQPMTCSGDRNRGCRSQSAFAPPTLSLVRC